METLSSLGTLACLLLAVGLPVYYLWESNQPAPGPRRRKTDNGDGYEILTGRKAIGRELFREAHNAGPLDMRQYDNDSLLRHNWECKADRAIASAEKASR